MIALLFLFFDDVNGSFFGFKEDLGNVFSNDSHAKQLNTANKQHNGYSACPACKKAWQKRIG